MRNLKKILFLLLLCLPALILAQIRLEPSNARVVSQLPQEKVFVHYNNPLIFAGEYIYYKLYLLDAATAKPGTLSKVAYVELIGEDGTRVFTHKLKLEEGTGRGDFFIPTTVPSGNYKLLGYTLWMLNGGERNIFSGDVAILNPYRGDQSAVTREVDTAALASERFSAEAKPQAGIVSGNLKLDLEKRTFTPRGKVTLKLSGNSGASEGNYSVSVRKSENIALPSMPATADFNGLYQDFSRKNSAEVYLPELRGELLTGRIIPAGNSTNIPVQNIRISLSIPGEDYVVKVAATNSKGEFFFNINGNYSGDQALLEVIGAEKEQYTIQLSERAEIDHRGLDFQKFYISPEMQDMIVARSVHNQIENAYYGVKPDTLLIPDLRKPFYEMQPITYNLEDYTRFPTLRETFIEIIGEAYVRNTGNGLSVRVRPLEKAFTSDQPPLILIDGVVVQDHTTFLDIPATEIEQISVLKNNYYLGSHLYQGILDVTTISGNFPERYNPANVTIMALDKPQPPKQYFKQQYSRDPRENIPDFRYQLLWQPVVEFNGNVAQLEFYTSDVKGIYEINVQGFSKDGSPVSLRETFRVE